MATAAAAVRRTDVKEFNFTWVGTDKSNKTVRGEMKAIATRQGDMFRAAMEDFSKHGSDVLSAATIEEKIAKQIDFAKKSYDLAIANSKELAGLYTKGQTEAFETLSARVADLTEEVKAAIAAKK